MRARTSKAKIEQQTRVSQFMSMRLGGMSLRDIGAKQEPAISPQAVHKALKAALGSVLTETAEQARTLEALRLDQLLAVLWPQCLLGDIGAINAALRVMVRRAQLLGLDKQPSFGFREDGESPGTVQIEIVGSPEPQRMRFLESEVQRLRQIEAGIVPVEGKPTIN